jgi:BCD family chlorophyll transporter-like MFS transporter
MTGAVRFGWFGIFRLGLVQASIAAVVVLTTSTLNRVMVVELALPAALPGFLIALHYLVQITRPRFGYGSDVGGRRVPWILGGMATLCIGGVAAASATWLMAFHPLAGIGLALLAFLLIGMGVGACGTSLLVLLAARVESHRRAAAATLTWLMMIASFAVTAGTVGALLDPFSFGRLVLICSAVAALALLVTTAAVWRIEPRGQGQGQAQSAPAEETRDSPGFMAALREVLREPHTRRFTIFVFLSMLAYSAQDLVLEPFAGAVFALTPGQSTQLGGLQHGGVLSGMLLVALLGTLGRNGRSGVLRALMLTGCLASASLLVALAIGGFRAGSWPLHLNVFALGLANGMFAVAAIGAMMGLVSQGQSQRDGMRMGVWGAAQAVAFGLGGLAGTVAIDVTRWLLGSLPLSYAIVFAAQAALFAVAAWLGRSITSAPAGARSQPRFTAAMARVQAVSEN